MNREERNVFLGSAQGHVRRPLHETHAACLQRDLWQHRKVFSLEGRPSFRPGLQFRCGGVGPAEAAFGFPPTKQL